MPHRGIFSQPGPFVLTTNQRGPEFSTYLEGARPVPNRDSPPRGSETGSQPSFHFRLEPYQSHGPPGHAQGVVLSGALRSQSHFFRWKARTSAVPLSFFFFLFSVGKKKLIMLRTAAFRAAHTFATALHSRCGSKADKLRLLTVFVGSRSTRQGPLVQKEQ